MRTRPARTRRRRAATSTSSSTWLEQVQGCVMNSIFKYTLLAAGTAITLGSATAHDGAGTGAATAATIATTATTATTATAATAATGATAMPGGSAASAQATVVLVHGAFADGSSWDSIIPRLQARGLHVVSVQNPLTSLADDVAATRRVLDAQSGPVVLVGHSWGGVVITQAGIDDKVKALVYVAAFAPAEGQSATDLG